MKIRTGMQPSKDCFFHDTKRCIGFHNCSDCDFHNLEGTKTAIINRIKAELKDIRGIYKKMMKQKGISMVDCNNKSIENQLGMQALDKFNGVQIMNEILNKKFGFKIPDVHSFTVQKMLKKISKNKEKYLEKLK